MPVDDGMGHSEYTRVKQEQFRYIVVPWIKIVGSVSARRGGDCAFHYVDLTAGSGEVDGEPGSPVIFLDEIRRSGMDYVADLCEIDPLNAHQLSERTRCERVTVWPEDNAAVLRELARRVDRSRYYGLVYWDANGSIGMPYRELRAIFETRAYASVDFLAYIAASSRKRCIGKGMSCIRLLDELAAVGKRHIFLRKPMGKWQWTFAFCTNWANPPSFDKIGLHRIDTPAGREIALRLNLTSEEYAARPFRPDEVPHLFGVPADAGVPGGAAAGHGSERRMVREVRKAESDGAAPPEVSSLGLF